MLQDVKDKISDSKRELDKLGPSLQDERQQRSFLSQVAGAFQERARAALAGRYNEDPVFEKANSDSSLAQ